MSKTVVRKNESLEDALRRFKRAVSKIFLEILVNDGKDALIQEIEKWKKEVKFLMILMNARTIAELDKKIRKIEL